MTSLDRLKELESKADVDGYNISEIDALFKALPNMLKIIEMAREAIEKTVDLLEPFQETGFLGEEALKKHTDALEAIRQFSKDTGGVI